MADKEQQGQLTSKEIKKLYIRGACTNSIPLAALCGIIYWFGLDKYVALALGFQWFVFLLHGLPQSSEKLYDLSGSLTHFAIVIFSLLRSGIVRSPRQNMVAIASIVWMVRLGSFLYLRITKDGRDDRFSSIKQNWLTFMGAWTIQAMWVMLIQMPVIIINELADEAPLNFIDMIALVGWIMGFAIEVTADIEKFVFRCHTENKEKFITNGMWAYSRHPNYFGEILMWSCISLSVSGSCSCLRLIAGAWLSPAFTAFLLLKVSGVPMVEAAGKKKWGDNPTYLHYTKHTNMIIPGAPALAMQKAA